MSRRVIMVLGVLVFAIASALIVWYLYQGKVTEVTATVETTPVPSAGDAADDPAIWHHPTFPSKSTIIGTDKRKGLAVYDLNGKELQFLQDGWMNNVDLRDGFILNGRPVTLVTASNQSESSIAIYVVNDETRRLENVAARRMMTTAPYGACMYRSPGSGNIGDRLRNSQ